MINKSLDYKNMKHNHDVNNNSDIAIEIFCIQFIL